MPSMRAHTLAAGMRLAMCHSCTSTGCMLGRPVRKSVPLKLLVCAGNLRLPGDDRGCGVECVRYFPKRCSVSSNNAAHETSAMHSSPQALHEITLPGNV